MECTHIPRHLCFTIKVPKYMGLGPAGGLQLTCFIRASLASNVLLRFQTNFKGKGSAKGLVSRRAGLAAGGGEGGKDGEVQRHERSFDQGAPVTMILQLFGSILILVIIVVIMVVMRLCYTGSSDDQSKYGSPASEGADGNVDLHNKVPKFVCRLSRSIITTILLTITVMIIFKILRNFVSTSQPTSRWTGLRKRQRLVRLSSSRFSFFRCASISRNYSGRSVSHPQFRKTHNAAAQSVSQPS